MLGGRIPSGGALMVPAPGRGMRTRQTTLAAGFLPKAEGSLQWMTMMAWTVNKLEISGSWITCWSPKSDPHGPNPDTQLVDVCI